MDRQNKESDLKSYQEIQKSALIFPGRTGQSLSLYQTLYRGYPLGKSLSCRV